MRWVVESRHPVLRALLLGLVLAALAVLGDALIGPEGWSWRMVLPAAVIVAVAVVATLVARRRRTPPRGNGSDRSR